MATSSAFTILPLSSDLLPGAAAVEQACFSLPWSEEGLRAELQKDGARCFAAVAGDTVVGWAGLESVCGEGSVTNIAVLPGFRRRGIGKALTLALLDALVDWQKEDKLFENQQLFKTPIVRNGRKATVGYQPEIWKDWE